MQKILFEDTTVVKQPYVEINGVEHEVHNGEYQGGTDLNANTFNTMQNNIGNYIDGDTSMGSIIVEDIKCKNMFNINGIIVSASSTSYTVSNNQITITGKYNVRQKINVKPNTDYYVSFNKTTTEGKIAIYNTSLTTSIHNYDSQNFTFNSGNYTSILLVIRTDGDDNTSKTAVFNNIQFEKGTIATDYTEYKEFSNRQIYSTTEQVVGTWIDGKPLYRKVIRYSGSLTSGTNQIPHGISNLDNVINKDCFLEFYSGSAKSIYGHGTYIDNTQFVNIGTINSTNVNLYIGSTWSSSFTNGCYIILEYTKTTD